MRQFQTIDLYNTVGNWVDAFNNNALASSDHTWYLGEMLYNGMLYTGLETIGGVKVESLTNLSIASISPKNIQFDNMYLYFRDINKILLVDKVTFDLTPFNNNQPMFLYINSDLGFRASQEFKQAPNEILLLRFLIGEDGVFKQCYVACQRFGSNVYDTADEFYLVEGCLPLPAGGLTLKLGDGSIKRSGIKFDYHQVPDVLPIVDKPEPFALRYITTENTVDYDAATTTDVITNKMLDYVTKELKSVPTGEFTAQRILLDVYENCLIMQYGNGSYPTMIEATSSVNNLNYPFPYDNLVYIPLGIMFIKEGATDLSDPEQCILVQHLNTTVNAGDSAFFAEDSYARGKLILVQQQLDDLKEKLKTTSDSLNAHLQDFNNPHKVTKEQIGLGNVDNVSLDSMTSQFDSRYVRKAGNETKTENLTVTGELTTTKQYIVVNGRRVYVAAASGQRVGDYLLP